jgi:predicted ATPase/DNA-binding CsgD family transcriptional regulator
LTRFIGRADAVDDVAKMLREQRLVTVTGTGGVGKTRLAAEVARRVADEFADGVWLAELAAIADPDPDAVPAAVAAALEIQLPSGAPAVESLAGLLARRQLLLVLDNCEHVLAGAAALCAAVLAVADDVRILATSREPIGVAGESRYRLAPLALPTPGELGEISSCDSAALFADRASLVDRHFTLSIETAPAVARMVTRLDGIPLAIELAAARIEALGVTQLADLLDDRFRWLVGADRQAAVRQRSLAATVEWSYQLLTDVERRVFRTLAIFPAGFSLEGAEAVAGRDAGQAIMRLVDCSMLVPPRPGLDGRARYLMLETLRAYGAQRLADADEQDQASAALAEFAFSVAAQAAPALVTSAEETAARWLDAEDAAIAQSLAWALDGDPAIAVRLAVALGPWWYLRGRYATGYKSLTVALAHAVEGSESWCKAQLWLGVLGATHAAPAVRLDHCTAVRDACADKAPSVTLVRALTSRAGMLANLSRLDEAGSDARQALYLAREIGDTSGEAYALYWLGGITHYTGEQDVSLNWLRQIELLDPSAIAGSTMRLCNSGLAIALIEADEFAAAERLCATTLELSQQAGDLKREAEVLFLLAKLDLVAGRIAEAREHLSAAIEIDMRLGVDILLLDILDICGHFCAQTRRWAGAVTIWAAHHALLQAGEIPDPGQDMNRRIAPAEEARRQLGPDAARAAAERGAAMTALIVAEYAMLLIAAPDEPDRPVAEPAVPRLSAREWELIGLVARGSTDAQIAKQLYISLSTVRSHLDRIRDKTGCRRRADLTRLALQASLV